jgi:3-oxoacyl-[acyl-carrier protein] reductase
MADTASMPATITADGGAATVAGEDAADEARMECVFQHATGTFGGIDVVVNTAGIMPLATIAEMSRGDEDR